MINVNDMMNVIGKIVFVLLCAKYRNEPEEYLAIMKIDRLSNNPGIYSVEYSTIIQNKKQEQGFMNNIENVKPTQILMEINNE